MGPIVSSPNAYVRTLTPVLQTYVFGGRALEEATKFKQSFEWALTQSEWRSCKKWKVGHTDTQQPMWASEERPTDTMKSRHLLARQRPQEEPIGCPASASASEPSREQLCV